MGFWLGFRGKPNATRVSVKWIKWMMPPLVAKATHADLPVKEGEPSPLSAASPKVRHGCDYKHRAISN